MSILITGIELPKDDHVRVLVMHPDGRVIDEWGHTFQTIPIPAHGRLIDADALIRDNGLREIPEYHEVVLAAPTIIEAEEGDT